MEEAKKIKIGDEITLEDGVYYISEIKNGQVILETWQELWARCNCRKCHSFQKNTGWLTYEKPKLKEKDPMTFTCRMGQFKTTHNLALILNGCKLKNYVYDHKKVVEEEVNKILGCKSCLNKKLVSKIIIPSYFGVDIIDVEKMESKFQRTVNV